MIRLANFVATTYLILFLATLSTAQTCSDDPALIPIKDKFPKVTCDALGQIFSDYTKTCGLSFPLTLIKKSDLTKNNPKKTTVTVVPDALVAPLERATSSANGNPVRITQNIGLSRLLSQVFPAASLGSLNTTDFIGATATASPAALTQIAIDTTTYATSCQATIAANVDFSGGFTFAPATLKASLDTSIQANSSSGLLMSVGTFDSPLRSFSHGAAPLYADLLMFGWRVRNGKPTDNLFYLSTAHGIAASQMTTAQLYSKLDISSNLTAGIFTVSTSSNVALARSVTDQLSSSLFDTVIDQPKKEDFLSIPTVAELQTLISSVQLTGAASPRVLLHSGDLSHVTLSVVGVPQDMCDRQNTSWSVAEADANNKDWKLRDGTLREEHSFDPQSIPICTFSFDIENAITGSKKEFTAKPVITGSYTGTSFQLIIQPLAFTASEFPQFGSRVPYNQDGKRNTVNGVDVWEYTVLIPVVQAPGGPGYNSISWLQNPRATCINGVIMDLAPSSPNPMAITPAGNSSATATLDYDLSQSKGELDPNDRNSIQCTLTSGKLNFTDTSTTPLNPVSRDISSSLGLTIKLPRIKPTVTLTQIPSSGTSLTFGGSIQGITDVAALNSSPPSLMEGNILLTTGQIKPDFSVSFSPVDLDPTIAHTLTIVLPPSNTTSGGVSNALVIPIRPNVPHAAPPPGAAPR